MTEPGSLDAVLADLATEGDYLDDVVSGPGVDFAAPSAAPGWTIGHQIGHLLWTDRASLLACTDPGLFADQAESFRGDPTGTADAGAMTESMRPQQELLADWRDGRQRLLKALAATPAGTRIPWFGPPMGAGTMASARIMETWAHGVDITDALGLPPAATARLRQVAELGVRTRDFGYLNRGLPAPAQPFRVELTGPAGEGWNWGPPEATERVSGPALDFCLLVTQRRHPADLKLTPSGSAASRWLEVAQVFAGPPGPGRDAATG